MTAEAPKLSFQQLLEYVRTLPPFQVKKLKKELEKIPKKEMKIEEKGNPELREVLLNFPQISDEEIAIIEEVHNDFGKWRIP